MKNIIIGADHRGFKLKEILKQDFMQDKNLTLVDVGTFNENKVDYPNIAKDLAQKMSLGISNTFGILICGSGIGVAIAANRFKFIRAAAVYNDQLATLSRMHNDANVICLAADISTREEALRYVHLFLQTEFLGEHHQARVDQLSKL